MLSEGSSGIPEAKFVTHDKTVTVFYWKMRPNIF